MVRWISIGALLGAAATAASAQDWVGVGGSATGGGISNAAAIAAFPAAAVDGQGRLVVAWVNNDGGRGDASQVYLRRWDGTAWTELGESASKGGVSGTVMGVGTFALAIDADDHPVVAWIDTWADQGSTQVYLRRWDGAAWIELGGSATGGGVSQAYSGVNELSVAVDAAGNPAVAWGDYLVEFIGIRTRIYLRRWDGTKWEELGASATDGGVSDSFHQNLSSPVVRIGADGKPVVAWVDMYDNAGSFEPAVYVRAWNGAAWSELGSSASGAGLSGGTGYVGNARMAIDPQDRPVVLWSGGSDGPASLYLKRWNGTAWTELGGSASGLGLSNEADASAGDPAIDAGPAGIAVAWTSSDWNRTRPNRVHLRRWSGATWAELGGSATGDGVSIELDPLTHAVVPSVASLPSGPAVAWFQWSEADPPVPQNVFLRRRDDVMLELTSPAQYRQDGTTALPVGGRTENDANVVLRGTVGQLLGHDVRLEIEVRELGTDFTGTPTGQSAAGAAGATFSCAVDGLVRGRGYHWRARGWDVVDGEAGPWSSFGGNAEDQADFVAGSEELPPPDDDDSDRRCSAGGAAGAWALLLGLAVILAQRR